jgi:hypothetical protein
MQLLHKAEGHKSPSSMLEAMPVWQGVRSDITPSLMAAFHRSAHSLLCEQMRRRKQHHVGSGIPQLIVAYAWAYDYYGPFDCVTIGGAKGFYLFYDLGSGSLKLYLTANKSAASVAEAVQDLFAWLARHGKTPYVLRSDAGSSENSTELKQALGTYPLTIDNSAASAPEHQQGNPEERQMQPFLQNFLILLNSTRNLGKRSWGLAALATRYHMNNNIGYLARIAGGGEMTKSQLITNRPHVVPECPIPYGTIVTAPFVGPTTRYTPPNQVFIYLYPANPGSKADIVITQSPRAHLQLYVRGGVRPLDLTSVLQTGEIPWSAEIRENDDGTKEIIGLPEPESIFVREGYPDPDATTSSLPIPTMAPFREASVVPDDLQRYITAADESLAMTPSVRITRSMARRSDIHIQEEPPPVDPLLVEDSTSVDPVVPDSNPPPIEYRPFRHGDDPGDLYDSSDDDSLQSPPDVHHSEQRLEESQGAVLHAQAVSAIVSPSLLPSTWQELYHELDLEYQTDADLAAHASAIASHHSCGYRELVAITPMGYQHITSPHHSCINPVVIMPHDGTEEMAGLSFGPTIMHDPELMARWGPPVIKEIAGHIGQSLFKCDAAFFAQFPHIKPTEWIIPCQEKRDKTSGEWMADKARLAICGNFELQAGLHPDRSKLYAPTLRPVTFKFLIAYAAYHSFDVSKADAKSAFQHTPCLRDQPIVIRLPPEVTGEQEPTLYYLTTLFQGLPEASRGWFNHIMSFLLVAPCNLRPSVSDPCKLTWMGPPTADPRERGQVHIGISTDDNLEIIAPNQASRRQLLVIRQAYADAGISLVCESSPDQLIGVGISYYPDGSITLRCKQQIADLARILFPDGNVPFTLTPMQPDWSEEAIQASPARDITQHRSVVGIMIFTGATRYDGGTSFSRHGSRTRTHSVQDWSNMMQTAAYLHTTKEVGLTYHRRRKEDPDTFIIAAAGDYADRVFQDGSGQLGLLVIGGTGLRGPSAPIHASSYKDSGIKVLSVPDGETKVTVSLVQTVLDIRCLAEDSGQMQPPTVIETDSQSVFLAASDFSGKTLFLRHRRRQLAFLMACTREHLIQFRLVPGDDQTADGLTKPLGPLAHWRSVIHLQGTSPAVLQFQDLVFQRYGSRSQPRTSIPSSAQSSSGSALQLTAIPRGVRKAHGQGCHDRRKVNRAFKRQAK